MRLGGKGTTMVLHDSAAGIQADAGAFCVSLPGTDAVGNGKV